MQGLAPAIVQDAASNEVLMLGFMNREACERTLSSGYVTFFSRTRNQLWTKGETSGNRLKVVGPLPTAITIPCCCRSKLKARVWYVTRARGPASQDRYLPRKTSPRCSHEDSTRYSER